MKIENPQWVPFFESLSELKKQQVLLAGVAPKGEQLVVQLEVAGRANPAKLGHGESLKQMMETFGSFLNGVRVMIAEAELHGVDSEQQKLKALKSDMDEKRAQCISHIAGHPYMSLFNKLCFVE